MYAGIYYSGSFTVSIYFIIVVILGLFVVLNLFLAILLSDFDAVSTSWINTNSAYSLTPDHLHPLSHTH